MKDFLVVVVEALQDDEVTLRLVHADDVDDLVFVRDFERQDLLADLAVDFVELEHHLSFMYFPLAFGLEPGAKTLQMDGALGAGALAG